MRLDFRFVTLIFLIDVLMSKKLFLKTYIERLEEVGETVPQEERIHDVGVGQVSGQTVLAYARNFVFRIDTAVDSGLDHPPTNEGLKWLH